jgi:hypothetical protein
MSKTHLIIPDTHAHPEHNNDRATLLARLIKDIRPDVVIHLGDSADLSSLSGYDKGKRGFVGRTYRADIESHLDFQDRLWSPVLAAKKKLPRSVFLIGNHEQRIDRALDLSPELVGTIGYADLRLEEWYDTVVPYAGQTPGIIEVDGIHYAHYFVSGVMGRPVGGEHPAYALLTKHFTSLTCGHIHVMDHSIRTTVDGRRIHGLVAGVYQDYDSPWAGEVNKLWWRGVVVKRNVENGNYDPSFISLEALRKEYGNG